MKVWEGKQVVGFLLTWRLLWHQLQQQMKDKYIISSCYIGTQSNLTQVMILKTKIWSSASELKWTKIEQFCMWIVNSDRQFYGTVHVISWTVVLILSSSEYGDLRKIGTCVCIIPRLCWQNKELFCTKSGQIWQRRGIYLTQEIWT